MTLAGLAERGDTLDKSQTGHLKLNVPYSELIFLEEIGAGGFSRVHIGEWQRTTVALKVSATVALKVSTSSTSEFYREATLMVYVACLTLERALADTCRLATCGRTPMWCRFSD